MQIDKELKEFERTVAMYEEGVINDFPISVLHSLLTKYTETLAQVERLEESFESTRQKLVQRTEESDRQRAHIERLEDSVFRTYPQMITERDEAIRQERKKLNQSMETLEKVHANLSNLSPGTVVKCLDLISNTIKSIRGDEEDEHPTD